MINMENIRREWNGKEKKKLNKGHTIKKSAKRTYSG